MNRLLTAVEIILGIGITLFGSLSAVRVYLARSHNLHVKKLHESIGPGAPGTTTITSSTGYRTPLSTSVKETDSEKANVPNENPLES